MPRVRQPHQRADGRWTTEVNGRSIYGHTLAECWAKAHRAEQAASADPAGPPVTVAEAIQRFLRIYTSEHAQSRLEAFNQFCGGELLAELPPAGELLAGYLDQLRATKYRRTGKKGKKTAPRSLTSWTIRHNVTYAKALLSHCHAKGWIRSAPPRTLPGVPTPVDNPRGLEPGAVARIFAHMDGHPTQRRALAVLRFCLATSCRPSEACGLRWEHITEGGRVAILPAHKTAQHTGEPRPVYLSEEARSVMPDPLPSGPVFRSRLRREYTPGGLRSMFRRAAFATLGVELGPYVLRHTFAQLARRQLPPDVLRKLMGHRSLRTTLKYYRVDEVALEQCATLKLLPPAAPAAAPQPPGAAGSKRGGRGTRRRTQDRSARGNASTHSHLADPGTS